MYHFLGMEAGELVIILDKFGVNVPLLSIQIANFLLVSYLLSRFALRDVIKNMDKRNKQIQDGLRYSDEMKKELSNIESKRCNIITEANSQASAIINTAQKSASDLLAKQKVESKEFAQNIISKAHLDIKNERNAMFSGLKNKIKDVVIQTTEQILSRELSDTEKDTYRQQSIEILTKMI